MPSIYQTRLDVCRDCHNYLGNERCKLVDLGCLKRFRMLLEDPETMCPAGKWRKFELQRSGENVQ